MASAPAATSAAAAEASFDGVGEGDEERTGAGAAKKAKKSASASKPEGQAAVPVLKLTTALGMFKIDVQAAMKDFDKGTCGGMIGYLHERELAQNVNVALALERYDEYFCTRTECYSRECVYMIKEPWPTHNR